MSEMEMQVSFIVLENRKHAVLMRLSLLDSSTLHPSM